MTYNLTEKELDRYEREFYYETGKTEDDPNDMDVPDELKINLIVTCISNHEYRQQVACKRIPVNEHLIVEFETWLKPRIRKSRLINIYKNL